MRLTDHDASFLYGETASGPMHGAGVTILEGEMTFEEYLDQVAARIHLAPRLRERLVSVPMNIAHPKWVPDPYFNLVHHIQRHRVPDGTNLDDVMKIATELCEPVLDRERSLWKTYFMEGIPGYTVLVQMMHHAMIDGASGVDLSMVMTDLQPDASPPGPPNEKWNPPKLPTGVELWNEALMEGFQRSAQSARRPALEPQRQRLLQRAYDTMQRFVSDPVITAPWNASTVGPKRLHEWLEYSFADFRAVRAALGGTINDIVLAVVSEAAARYLEAHGETVDGRYMRLMCPVNVRREDETGELGNRVSAMYPTLPAWKMDIGERLAEVCAETARLKANQEPQALELLMETNAGSTLPVAMGQTMLVGTPFDPTAALAQNPPAVMPTIGPRPPLVGFNFTCTNVPGVQVPQYIAGRKIVRVLGTLMLSGTLGYGVGVGSYDQRLFFNLTSDPRLLADLELMRGGIEDCFAELLELAESKRPKAANG